MFLPNWPIDLVRRHRQRCGEPVDPKAAILLVTTVQNRSVIARCCDRSHACGVRPSMTLAHARALLGTAPVVEAEHQPQRDELFLHRLASWATRFTPLVTPDPPDGLILDVTGCVRLYGGEQQLLGVLAATLNARGFANRLCCASTIGCAWGVARFGQEAKTVISPGDEHHALAQLPVEALRLDSLIINALHEVNIRSINDLLAIHRDELRVRFGMEILQRVDQGLGRINEVIDPVQPEEPLRAERIFDGAVVDVEALMMVCHGLIAQVASELAVRESGATRMEFMLKRLGAAPVHLHVHLSAPSRAADHLWSIWRTRIETVHMGYGIEKISLTIRSWQRIAHEQTSRWNDESSSACLVRAQGELVDTLSQRLGAQRISRMSVAESYCPEHVARFHPCMYQTISRGTGTTLQGESTSHVIDEDRPSWLWARPEPASRMVCTPDGAPVVMWWRGGEHRIVTAIGPQRVQGEWWGRSAWHGWRDYFKIQNESGRWLWVFCASAGDSSGDWYVHGAWA